MKEKITNPGKDPLGTMMLDYLSGDHKAFVTVESDTMDMWKMTGKTMFRTFGAMNRIERKALSLCRGKILDIGAGSGCHTLYLQNKNKQVHALDLSCGSIEVMKKRNVVHPIYDHLFSLKNKRYDTLLMLMNGIGIVGSLDGLNLFFQFIKTILNTNGQILVDSTDLAALYDPKILASANQEYYGQTRFTMTYKKIISDPFDWLYIDFHTLIFHAGLHGFECEKIMADKTGKYLARITLKNPR
ncbi:MAG: methyltransferase domain-containing protein [Pseudomonadota bacterium]